MSQIHIVSSGKGSSGKSLFAATLGDLLIKAGRKVERIDADPQKQVISTLYGDSATPIELGSDPDLEEQPMVILSLAQESDTDDVIVDLAADTDVHLNRWIDAVDLESVAKSLDLTIIKWWVGDTDLGSLRELALSYSKYPDIKHVLVMNLSKARRPKWEKVIESCAEIKGAIAGGLSTIEFPKLYGTLAEDYREAGITWETVLDEHSAKTYKKSDLISAGIINKWTQQCQQQIDNVLPVELPKKSGKKLSAKAKRASTKAIEVTEEKDVSGAA